MAYGNKYIYNFANKVTTYTLEISEKDYSRGTTNIKGASSSVVHSWDTDDPKPPIKGSSLVINLINEGGLLPLDDFYSTDDEKFKAKLIWHADLNDIVLFEGFVVQDDSSEPMLDYNHEISISATDNLGLLKDVPFNQAPFQIYSTLDSYTANVAGFPPHQIVRTTPGSIISPGDRLVISGGTGLDGNYTVDTVLGTTGSANIYVKEAVPSVGTVSATITINTPDFYTLRSLLSIVHSCISATGLELDTRIFANINEVSQTTDCFLEQILIDPQTFYNGSSWDNCYEVLTKILERFELTLFQAKGTWNIVRWNELRYYDYAIPGFLYDEDFVFQNGIFLDESAGLFSGWNKFLIGVGEQTQAETGLSRRINRSYKYTKETFNYKQPEHLLRNFDLQELGNLRTSYADGSNTVYEYDFKWWSYTNGYPTITGVNGAADFFIRVIIDSVGNEIDRYAVTIHDSIHSSTVEANAGDYFTYSFSFKGLNNNSTGIGGQVFIELDDGITPLYICEPGDAGDPTGVGWKTTTGWNFTVTGDTGTEWNTVEVQSRPIPHDGLLTFYLNLLTDDANDETQFRDIRLEYVPLINQSSKIIGQVHKSTQPETIKKNDEREISIDVSPRNSIAGTLFLDSVTGVLQDRAGQWTRATETESLNLGNLITFENEYLRRVSRSLLEGNFYGLLSAAQTVGPSTIHDHLSLITVIRYTYFPDLNFIFGKLEIDYSQNTASGTLYEMYKDTETDTDLSYVYTFTFLYDTK